MKSKIEQLKDIHREIRPLVNKTAPNYNLIIETVNIRINENIEDFSVLRMLLDAIMPISDEELIIPLKNRLVQLLENILGKKIK